MEVYSNKDVSTIISKINFKKELPFLPQEVWELIFRLKYDLENREIYEFMMFNHDPKQCRAIYRFRGRSNQVMIYEHNILQLIIEDCRFINKFMLGKLTIIKMLGYFSDFIYKWYFWIYDHLYIQSINKFMCTINEKVVEFYDTLNSCTYYQDAFYSYKNREEYLYALDILYDVKQFINVYHRHKTSYFNKYRKNSRTNFFLAKQANEILNYGDSNGYYSCVYVDEDAYNKNEQPMLEYELYIYFREYYNTVYDYYMKLRSGNKIIPIGKRPKVVWYLEHATLQFY